MIAGGHVIPSFINRITAAQIGVSLRVRLIQDTISFVFFFVHGIVFPSQDPRLLKRDLLIGLRPPGPFVLWEAGGEGVVSPAQALGVVGFPVVGHP